MSYSQEIYDAVRSKIIGGDVGQAVRDAARDAFDISWTVEAVKHEYLTAAYEQQRASVLFRPTLSVDGSMWCALLGDDLQSGVAGFGETPDKTMRAFDEAFANSRTPSAARAARIAAEEACQIHGAGRQAA